MFRIDVRRVGMGCAEDAEPAGGTLQVLVRGISLSHVDFCQVSVFAPPLQSTHTHIIGSPKLPFSHVDADSGVDVGVDGRASLRRVVGSCCASLRQQPDNPIDSSARACVTCACAFAVSVIERSGSRYEPQPRKHHYRECNNLFFPSTVSHMK